MRMTHRTKLVGEPWPTRPTLPPPPWVVHGRCLLKSTKCTTAELINSLMWLTVLWVWLGGTGPATLCLADGYSVRCAQCAKRLSSSSSPSSSSSTAEHATERQSCAHPVPLHCVSVILPSIIYVIVHRPITSWLPPTVCLSLCVCIRLAVCVMCVWWNRARHNDFLLFPAIALAGCGRDVVATWY